MVRLKNRYFLAEIVFADQQRPPKGITSLDTYISIKDAVQDCYGDYGIGATKDGLNVKYINKDTNMVIVQARRDHYRMVQAALTFVKKIGKHSCFLRTIHIGGTIRACQKFLIQHHRRHLPLLLKQCRTEEDKTRMEKGLLSACLKMEHTSQVEEKERSISEIAGEKMQS